MPELEAVIGLEIHVQLSTRTKMFCGCELSFGDEPNVHTCPICLAHPGVLPVPNEEAIAYALRIGLALDCEIAPRSIFHRKNYFYPDNPKAYQISQYDIPICGAGKLGDIRITRAHLEEDAAKTIHAGASGRIHGSTASLVDFNRGGTPLVEIVTEPDLRSAAEAGAFARLLRTTVRQLEVSDVNMEEGSLRVDANVSVRPQGSEELGTKTELKNMNSFAFLERGVRAEIDRQTELLRAGQA
ncbi:MAG TPA: Asp-tRNA(Asn)/Glu-tRNA(Gln) amidotransferase subunit GatB, partial [Solirubrobacterales bacterium]|nr:Asp-tRNA(Asn)/Glu-tRNA(Gln) amidotransferase subunit GatB [Solirubrobacterales bacterium]